MNIKFENELMTCQADWSEDFKMWGIKNLPAEVRHDTKTMHYIEMAWRDRVIYEKEKEPAAWLQIGLAPHHDGVVIPRSKKAKLYDKTWWKFEPLHKL